jgi:hypothetical protein
MGLALHARVWPVVDEEALLCEGDEVIWPLDVDMKPQATHVRQGQRLILRVF